MSRRILYIHLEVSLLAGLLQQLGELADRILRVAVVEQGGDFGPTKSGLSLILDHQLALNAAPAFGLWKKMGAHG